MATQQLEVERKFDVDPSFAVPDLARIAGVASVDGPVEHALEAVYFDTSDLRLARARITLRRRTGGPDAGWHLKLPADAGARWELHSPLGPAAERPPAAVTVPVQGVLRGAPAAPVATLRTRRLVTALRDSDGRTMAEVADDTVTATVPAADQGGPAEVRSWREVEVELGSGTDVLLRAVGERLLSAGASPSSSASKLGRALAGRLPAPAAAERPSAGEVVLDAVRGQVSALQAADVMLRTDRPDAVRRLRAAARRLRSITAAARPVLDRATTDPLRGELTWLGVELSEVHDAEAALARLREVVASEPAELVLGPVAARLQQNALRLAVTGHERALSTISSPRYLGLLDQLHALLEAPALTDEASRPAGPVLRRALRRAGRRVRRRLEEAAKADVEKRPAALHALRMAAKRARYTGEMATGVLGRPAKDLVEACKRVEDVLGEQENSVVARVQCRELGLAAEAAGENAWTYGRLHGLEQARADRAATAFGELAPSLGPVLRRAGRKR